MRVFIHSLVASLVLLAFSPAFSVASPSMIALRGHEIKSYSAKFTGPLTATPDPAPVAKCPRSCDVDRDKGCTESNSCWEKTPKGLACVRVRQFKKQLEYSRETCPWPYQNCPRTWVRRPWSWEKDEATCALNVSHPNALFINDFVYSLNSAYEGFDIPSGRVLSKDDINKLLRERENDPPNLLSNLADGLLSVQRQTVFRDRGGCYSLELRLQVDLESKEIGQLWLPKVAAACP